MSSLEIVDDVLCSFSVDMTVAIQVMAQLLNSISNIRPGADCEIHQRANKRAIRCSSKKLGVRGGVITGDMRET